MGGGIVIQQLTAASSGIIWHTWSQSQISILTDLKLISNLKIDLEPNPKSQKPIPRLFSSVSGLFSSRSTKIALRSDLRFEIWLEIDLEIRGWLWDRFLRIWLWDQMCQTTSKLLYAFFLLSRRLEWRTQRTRFSQTTRHVFRCHMALIGENFAYTVSHWLNFAYTVSHWLNFAYTVSYWLNFACGKLCMWIWA